MKNAILILIFLAIAPIYLKAQVLDTAAVRREVDSLLEFSQKLIDEKKFEEAINAVNTADIKSIEVWGSKSYLHAVCLFYKAKTYSRQKEFEYAKTYYLESLNIFELNKEVNDKIYEKCLFNLGRVFQDLGQFNLSETYIIKGKSVLESLSTELTVDHGIYANTLGVLYNQMGDYKLSESYLLKAKKIREELLGYNDLSFATTLHNLGDTYRATGRFKEAEILITESAKIREKMLGCNHPSYALSLSNLANVYINQGKYGEAEQLYIKSLNIIDGSLGKKSRDYSGVLNNLASLYNKIGNYDKSESLFTESISISKSVNGENHPNHLMILHNLANMYSYTNRNDKAVPIFTDLLQVIDTTLGTDHPFYSLCMHNLATSYLDLGEYEKSLAFFLESKNIREKTIGVNNIEYSYSLYNLANLYEMIGKNPDAEILYHKCANIRKEILGEDSDLYLDCLVNLSFFYWRINDISLSNSFIKMSSEKNRKKIIKNSTYLSEYELSKLIYTFIRLTDRYYSFSHITRHNISDCYDNTLFYKGSIFNVMNNVDLLLTLDSTKKETSLSLKLYKYSLSKEYAKPIAERDSARIAEWEEKANTIEKELVRTVAGYGDLIRQVSWEEVKQQLHPDEAAVELVSYRYYTPEPTDSTMYAALVLLPGDTAPHFVPLFEEHQLQALLHPPDLEEEFTVKKLYSSNSELLNLLWKPLEPLLRDVKTIYYSPAGLLHRVNPAALRDVDKQPLSARHQWVRVGSTRELVTGRLANRSFAQDTSTTLSAAVWGGITYEMDSTAFAAVNPLDSTAEPLEEFQRKDGKFRYMAEDGAPALSTGTRSAGAEGWSALAGSALEAKQIGTLLQNAGFRTEVFSNYSASEERFKTLGQAKSSPRILHVATHGFAYPDPKKEPERNLSGQEPVYKLQDDPMLRSGLILAGANHYWAAKRPLQDREDGVLVAYEVRDLNLRNTELAVLSACQTGLGDVVGSEGVYGLQRAFRIAGAKFLIVSLWEVPDDKTRELMQLFYENWVNKRESLRDAFNHAQETFRAKEPNPYNWAGFVLIE